MTADQIIAAIPDCPAAIAQAIRDLDARNAQTNGGATRLNELEVHRRLTLAIKRAGGPAALAAKWKVSRQHVYDVDNGRRPPGPALQKALGIRRLGAGRTMYEVIDL